LTLTFLPRCCCLPVRPSVKRVNCDRTKALSEKKFHYDEQEVDFSVSLRWTVCP